MRLYAAIAENKAGRGPCYLDLTHISQSDSRRLQEAYLSMSPSIVLKWADEGVEPNDKPLEICGSEPYLVGGHGQAGYWVDHNRQTTLQGLYAAGDVAGGAPKKYVTGCFAEGEIAALAALAYIETAEQVQIDEGQVWQELVRTFGPLDKPGGGEPEEYEARLQKTMDEYAGGIAANYELCATKLIIARELLGALQQEVADHITATDMYQLVKAHEVLDRVLVARALVEHLLYRKETRWRSYQERVDYPGRDDSRWHIFVNSVYDRETAQIKILERSYVNQGRPEGTGGIR